MKAGPALSMLFTKKAYHHNVPLLSLSRSARRLPTHSAGTEIITGMNIKTNSTNLTPVHKGSQRYVSRNRIILCPKRYRPLSSSLTVFFSSARDTSSMRPSAVCSVPPFSFSDRLTNTAVPRAALAVALSILPLPLNLWLDLGGRRKVRVRNVECHRPGFAVFLVA